MGSIFNYCPACASEKTVMEAHEKLINSKMKRKNEFEEALSRKRNKDILTFQQCIRANKEQQSKINHTLSVKETLHSDIVEFLRGDKVKVLSSNIVNKVRDAAKLYHQQIVELNETKQRLIDKYNSLEVKLRSVDDNFEEDLLNEDMFEVFIERKQMLLNDDESRLHQWNRNDDNTALDNDSSKIAEEILVGYMKTWARELERARQQLKRNTVNQAIYSKQISIKLEQCQGLESQLLLNKKVGRTEAEVALKNAQDQTHWLTRSLDDVKRGQSGLEDKVAQAQDKCNQEERKVVIFKSMLPMC